MSDELIYLDDLVEILTEKTNKGKIKWEPGEPRGFITRVDDITIGIFFEPARFRQRQTVLGLETIDAGKPDILRMSVVDRAGRPIKSCVIEQDSPDYEIYENLWKAASKGARLADTSLKEVIDKLKEIA